MDRFSEEDDLETLHLHKWLYFLFIATHRMKRLLINLKFLSKIYLQEYFVQLFY